MRLDNTNRYYLRRFRKIKRNYVADRGTSPAPDGQIISFDLLKRVLPLAFPQMRLALPSGITCAVFAKSNEITSPIGASLQPRRANYFARSLETRPSACFSANASCFAFRYYLRRGRLLFLGHNFSRGAPPSSLKRFYRRAKNYFHHYILIGRQMSSKLPSNLRELYANFERKNRLACAFA